MSDRLDGLTIQEGQESDCTTHFHACDCREEKFKALEAKVAELEKFMSTVWYEDGGKTKNVLKSFKEKKADE